MGKLQSNSIGISRQVRILIINWPFCDMGVIALAHQCGMPGQKAQIIFKDAEQKPRKQEGEAENEMRRSISQGSVPRRVWVQQRLAFVGLAFFLQHVREGLDGAGEWGGV